MKKRFLLVLMLVLLFPINVFAEDNTTEESEEQSTWTGNYETLFDSKGRVVQGIFKSRYDVEKRNSRYDNSYNYVFGNGIIYILAYPADDGKGDTIYNMYVHVVDANNTHVDNGKFKCWNISEDLAYHDVTEDNREGDIVEVMGFGTHYLSEITNCTIPIFKTNDINLEQNINKYVSAGEYVPNEDVPYEEPAKQYDDSIELPQNVKLSSGYNYNLLARQNLLFPDKDIVLTWDQTKDTSNYSYEIELKYNLEHVTNTNLLGKETTETYNSSYVKIGNGFYAGANNVTHTIGHDKQYDELISITQTNGWTGTKSYIKNIYIRVRNISGGKCSNWVVVSLDVPNKSASATVQDDDGNSVADDQYNNYDAINGDQVNSDNVGSLDDFKKITDFIKNGFGLLGSDGLVGLLSSFFGNIFPQSFWNIITIGMAVIILVGIINFLLKR